MVTLNENGRESLGVELANFVEKNCSAPYGKSKNALLPDHGGVPDDMYEALDRAFGRADTIDRGDVAYWRVPLDLLFDES